MSQYSTGEVAKLCNVSVRTVQFYDTKGLIEPTERTEGGRRLYSDSDIKKLHLICLLKSLGLSLSSIKGILNSDSPEKILLLLLEQQEKEIRNDIYNKDKQLKSIQIVKESIKNTNTIPVQTIIDIESMMKRKKKLRKVQVIMIAIGLLMDIIEIGTLLLWIFKGVWIPFAVGMPIVVIMGVIIGRIYYKNTEYICPECGKVFRPTFRESFFAKHTFKTRKLKCPACGKTGFCVETADENEKIVI